MKFKELKEKYGIVMLDRFFTDPVEMQYRETYLLKLLLNLYHNEVDAHYNVEQFLKSEYEGKFAIQFAGGRQPTAKTLQNDEKEVA